MPDFFSNLITPALTKSVGYLCRMIQQFESAIFLLIKTINPKRLLWTVNLFYINVLDNELPVA